MSLLKHYCLCKSSLSVRHSWSMYPYGRRGRYVQCDLQYDDGSHCALKAEPR
jgi:coproporphyrinogen III oxidase